MSGSYVPPVNLLHFCEQVAKLKATFNLYFLMIIKVVTEASLTYLQTWRKMDRIHPNKDFLTLHEAYYALSKRLRQSASSSYKRFELLSNFKRIGQDDMSVIQNTTFQLDELVELLLYWLRDAMRLDHIPTEREVVEWTLYRMLSFPNDATEIGSMLQYVREYINHPEHIRFGTEHEQAVLSIEEHRFTFAIVMVCISYLAKQETRPEQYAEARRICLARWKDVLLY